jgi:hypothetical protein
MGAAVIFEYPEWVGAISTSVIFEMLRSPHHGEAGSS